MFRFTYRIEEKDFIEFQKIHNHFFFPKAFFISIKLIIPVLFTIMLVMLCINSLRQVRDAHFSAVALLTTAAMLIIPSILWVIFADRIFDGTVKSSIERIKKANGGKLPFSQEATLILDNGCLHHIDEFGENKVAFIMIEKVLITKDAIGFYLGPRQVILLPASAFQGESEKQDFMDYIKSSFTDKVIYAAK